MLVVAPVRIKLEEEQSLAEFLQSMQNRLVSTTPHERDVSKIVEELVGRAQVHQSYLSWHSRGDDLCSPKTYPARFKEVSTATLKPRRDLST